VTEAELRKKLLDKAGLFLSRRPCSRGELAAMLLKIAGPDSVEPVLDRLEQLKLLNDSEYAYNFAFNQLKFKGWGPVRVHQNLLLRKVPPGLAESTMNSIRAELSDREVLEGYLEKHCRRKGLPLDRRGIAGLVSHLSRRGFPEETILQTLRQKVPSALWERFETGE
jgi:SOS response regulatory protein OraA/RecX